MTLVRSTGRYEAPAYGLAERLSNRSGSSSTPLGTDADLAPEVRPECSMNATQRTER
jgi:hypothetical protein